MQRHETDPLSLAFGVIFAAIGGAFLFGNIDAFEFVSVWALPAVLLATGIVLGAVAIARHRKIAGTYAEDRAETDELFLG